MNVSNIYIWNIKDADYCYIINGISESEAIKLWQNIDLTEKTGILQKINTIYISLNYLYIFDINTKGTQRQYI